MPTDSGRVERLVERLTPELRRRFLQSLALLSGSIDLEELATLLEQGRVEEALANTENAMRRFTLQLSDAYVAGGVQMSALLEEAGVVIGFDSVNTRAVRHLQENQLRLVAEFTQQQVETTRQVLVDGTTRGLNPRDQARAFRSSIGLTARQELMAQNYRALLEQGSSEALRRELRDRRFDPTVEAVIRGERSLSGPEIERMVNRYRERAVLLRAETIARTETLGAVHAGGEELLQQAVDQVLTDRESIIRTWLSAGDARVRDSHTSASGLSGQQRPLGEPFITGDGVLIRYPGDPLVPASERVNCRCVLVTRIAS